MQKTKIAILVSSVLFSTSLYAEELNSDEMTTLETVHVRETAFSQKMGTQKLTQEEIKRLPSTNGNLTELLKSNPNVQFSNLSELSTNAGEIRPEEVSFHGERYYNNNFTIDGISNNDNVNPATNNAGRAGNNPTGFEAYDLPSAGSQSFWLNSKLVKTVEAFDSNVSAKYGNFTGGVVNAETIDPSFDGNHGSISYRTTRGAWAKYHVQAVDQESFNHAQRLDFQPDFRKHEYSINVSQPLSDNTSLLFSYNRTTSDIYSAHSVMRDKKTGDIYTETQKRLNETYLLKGVHFAENGDQWKATLMYSPHKSKHFRQNVMNSGYANTGGGYSAQLDWEKQFDKVKMTTKFAYKKTGNEIKNDESVYRRYVASDSIGWLSNTSGNALYGGYGTNETEKETYTLKQDFSVTEFDWGSTTHKPIFGWQVDYSQAKYQRNNEAWQYYYTNNSNLICGEMNECIENEQYANSAQAYPIRKVKVNDSNFAWYVEDNMRYKNLELNLGLRADYNAFLRNVNIAPRVSFSYDLFGNQQSQLFGGYNRYYSTSLLAYKLRQSIGVKDSWERNALTNYEWQYKSSNSTPIQTGNADLETPYSDEFVLGFGQKVAGINTTLKWVHRNGRKQFARGLKDGRYVMNNSGWNKNDTVTITLDKIGEYQFQYANIDWGLSARASHNRSSGSSYDAKNTEDYSYAVYNNQLINADDLPSADFSGKWGVSFDLNTEFPTLGLTWGQRLTYSPKRNYIQATAESINCQYATHQSVCGSLSGQDIDAVKYEDATQGSQFMLDWRFGYKLALPKKQSLEFTLDVNNVLDKVAVAKSTSKNTYYKMGRNYWFGVSYNW